MIGLGLAAFVVLVAVIGPFVAPNAPDALVTLAFGKPSGQFLLGGDFLGRDVLSRVLDGGWVLLIMAACATASGSPAARRPASQPPTCAGSATGSSCERST